MKKTVLFGALATLGLLGTGRTTQAQGAIVNGGTYKMTHYGVVADGSAAAYGVPAGTALCMDVNLGLATAGATIGQWGDNGLDGQRYIFEKQSDGSFKLRHKGTVMYVQPIGLNKAALTHIEQNVLLTTNDDAQRWFITDPNNNGRYKFTLKNSANAAGVAQCLEIGFGSATPGGFIDLYDDNAFEQAQRWVLTLTGSPLATRSANDAALRTEVYPTVLGQGQPLSLRVDALRSGAAQVELVDVLGRLAYTQSATLQAGATMLAISVPKLAAGTYIVRVHQGEFSQQTRIVQQ